MELGAFTEVGADRRPSLGSRGGTVDSEAETCGRHRVKAGRRGLYGEVINLL